MRTCVKVELYRSARNTQYASACRRSIIALIAARRTLTDFVARIALVVCVDEVVVVLYCGAGNFGGC
jgi:hypothetical protein